MKLKFSNVSLPSLIFETPLLYMKRFFYWLEKDLSVFE
ncbi:YpzE [Bacillus sp. JS]|nr:YpzE [Bacillus sp. JS]